MAEMCSMIRRQRRKARPMKLYIKCDGSRWRSKSEIRGSVRGRFVSFWIRGPDPWPHLTREQALRLANWIHDAVDELDERKNSLKRGADGDPG
jgi:hypothetical protein